MVVGASTGISGAARTGPHHDRQFYLPVEPVRRSLLRSSRAEMSDQVVCFTRRRYVANGRFTQHLTHLHLRPADQPILVQSVLDGSNNDPRDQLLAVMIIVWRFRNNMLHGEKWAYQL